MTMIRLTTLSLLAACTVTVPEPLSDCDTRDPMDVLGLTQTNTTLAVLVGHSSGCAEHAYAICWPGLAIAESDPPLVDLAVWHDDGGEPCEAYQETTVEVDLTPIFDAAGDTVQLSVDGMSRLVER